jgi:DNA-binding HxlR family transcriptional regulator
VLWELREGPLTFQTVQARCDGMSTSVLSQRLGELREAGLIDREDGGYRLSEQGRVLLDRLDWVEDWTRQWAAAMGDAFIDRPRSRGG